MKLVRFGFWVCLVLAVLDICLAQIAKSVLHDRSLTDLFLSSASAFSFSAVVYWLVEHVKRG